MGAMSQIAQARDEICNACGVKELKRCNVCELNLKVRGNIVVLAGEPKQIIKVRRDKGY